MVNTYIKLLLPFALLVSLVSCEDVVDLPLSEVPKLAIRSDLSQDGLVAVVYLSKQVTDNQPTEYIENAKVKVFKGDQFLEELSVVRPSDSNTSNPPFYKTHLFKPDFDVEYTLVVEVENFKSISSTTSVPKPVNLEDVQFSPAVNTDANNIVVVDFDISMSLKDPMSVRNFYHLKFYQELVDYTLDASGDTIFSEPYFDTPTHIEKIDEQSPPQRYKGGQGYLFNDVDFDGQKLTLNFKGHYTYNPLKTIPGTFRIELRTVSEDYFLFHDSINRQGQGNNHLGEGVVVYNNIDNGLGNFAGFTSKVNAFKLSD